MAKATCIIKGLKFFGLLSTTSTVKIFVKVVRKAGWLQFGKLSCRTGQKAQTQLGGGGPHCDAACFQNSAGWPNQKSFHSSKLDGNDRWEERSKCDEPGCWASNSHRSSVDPGWEDFSARGNNSDREGDIRACAGSIKGRRYRTEGIGFVMSIDLICLALYNSQKEINFIKFIYLTHSANDSSLLAGSSMLNKGSIPGGSREAVTARLWESRT